MNEKKFRNNSQLLHVKWVKNNPLCINEKRETFF